jgi:hypothetical protein
MVLIEPEPMAEPTEESVSAPLQEARQPTRTDDWLEAKSGKPLSVSYRCDGKGDAVHMERVNFFSFFEELAEPLKKVVQTAWASRGKLVHDVRAYTVLFTTTVTTMPGRAANVLRNEKLHALLAEEEDPEALAAVIFGTGGALCLGSMGAVICAAAGGATGTAVGVVPALFTFGLSMPLGAIVGGATGFGTGLKLGGSFCFVAGATSGVVVAYLREDIRSTTIYVVSVCHDVYDVTVARPLAFAGRTSHRVGVAAKDGGRALAEVASSRRAQACAVGAATGAVALGTAGATGGALVGGTTGALVGVVPAFFTFGLSIPIGAVVGGSAGVCVGGAAGTTVGFLGGGLAGGVGYTYRDAPQTVMTYAKEAAMALAATAGFRLSAGGKGPDVIDHTDSNRRAA